MPRLARYSAAMVPRIPRLSFHRARDQRRHVAVRRFAGLVSRQDAAGRDLPAPPELAKDLERLAASKAFEQQAVIADPDGQARTAVLVSRAAAHARAVAPFAAELLDDGSTLFLEYTTRDGGTAGHRIIPRTSKAFGVKAVEHV